MKTIRIIAIVLLLALIGVSAYLHFHQPKPVPAPVHHHQAAPAQVSHGVKPPYNDCVPNETGQLERDHQAELTATEQAMAKYNDTPNQQSNANFLQLQAQYKQQVADFDTCTMVTN